MRWRISACFSESLRRVLLRKRLLHRSRAKPLRGAQTTARTTEFSPSVLQKSHDEHEANLKRISRFPPPK